MNTEFLNPLRDQWNKLSSSERRLAMAGGAVLGVLLLYLLVWSPLQKELGRLRVSVPEERAQLQQMRDQAAAIQPLRARIGSAPAPGMLVSVVDQSASARGVRGFISRLELDGSAGVSIVAEAMPFNNFISWLAELQDRHALVVESTSIDSHITPGTVNVKMKLRVETP